MHLGYCTNVHPGESLGDVEQSLRREVLAVKQTLGAVAPFDVGLRLSALACEELTQQPERLHAFKALLDELGMVAFTLNGFPYGAFHGTPVKERVYEPDWADPLRLRYTEALFSVLEHLLPAHIPSASVSTLPGTFKPKATPERIEKIAVNLVRCCANLVERERLRGKRLVLAIEPEPYCLLETTDETLRFFADVLLSETSRNQLDALTGCGLRQAETLLRRHLGVCLDTCHAAVEFEPAEQVYATLARAGITVAKVQISAGLVVDPRRIDHIATLQHFDEPVYLHQTVQRNASELTRFVDLGAAFEARSSAEPTFASDAEWRVHFHVPLSAPHCGIFQSTRHELVPLLRRLASDLDPPQLEVETYTWNVLPPAQRPSNQAEAIAAELRWAAATLGTSLGRSLGLDAP